MVSRRLGEPCEPIQSTRSGSGRPTPAIRYRRSLQTVTPFRVSRLGVNPSGSFTSLSTRILPLAFASGRDSRFPGRRIECTTVRGFGQMGLTISFRAIAAVFAISSTRLVRWVFLRRLYAASMALHRNEND